jgi:hypothetical protein
MLQTIKVFGQKILYGFGFGCGMGVAYSNKILFKIDTVHARPNNNESTMNKICVNNFETIGVETNEFETDIKKR